MLPLPPIRTIAPESLEDALELLARGGPRTRLLAGGTDLLPNLKHGLVDVDTLVLLHGVPGLRGVTLGPDGGLSIGALTTLAQLAGDRTVRETYPALAKAVGEIAGPQLRNMGTLGGNLCLDTRCRFYNQTAFWRQALGGCLKRDGDVCHVVPGGTRCVAAMSSDSAAILTALGATMVLRSHERGARELPMDRFFQPDGARNTVIEPDEFLLEVRLPPPAPRAFSGYRKLRARASIDFPLLSVAVAGRRTEDGALAAARVVVGVIGARPRELTGVGPIVEGRKPGPALFAELGAAAHRQCKPLENVGADPAWRHAMIPVLVRRTFAEALGAEADDAGEGR